MSDHNTTTAPPQAAAGEAVVVVGQPPEVAFRPMAERAARSSVTGRWHCISPPAPIVIVPLVGIASQVRSCYCEATLETHPKRTQAAIDNLSHGSPRSPRGHTAPPSHESPHLFGCTGLSERPRRGGFSPPALRGVGAPAPALPLPRTFPGGAEPKHAACTGVSAMPCQCLQVEPLTKAG